MKKLTPVVFLLLLSIVGCGRFGSPASDGANNAPPAQTKPAAPAADAKPAIADAYAKLRNAPFVTVKWERAGSPPVSSVEQYSAADESFSRTNVAGDETEVIIVGGDNFSRMNSNWPWKKDSGPPSTAAETFFSSHDQRAKVFQTAAVTPDAEDSVGGKAANAFKIESAMPGGSAKVWIDKQNGRLLKVTTGGGLTETYDYDTPVRIERPRLEKP